MPKTIKVVKMALAKATAASGTAPRRPTITLAVNPISIWPAWPKTIGNASSTVALISARQWT
jgi:hypothetical protein